MSKAFRRFIPPISFGITPSVIWNSTILFFFPIVISNVPFPLICIWLPSYIKVAFAYFYIIICFNNIIFYYAYLGSCIKQTSFHFVIYLCLHTGSSTHVITYIIVSWFSRRSSIVQISWHVSINQWSLDCEGIFTIS